MVNTLFGTRCRYTNGTNIFRTDRGRQIPIQTSGFSYQTGAVVKAVRSGIDAVQVPLEIQKREFGASKAVSARNVISVLRALARLWWDVTVVERRRYRAWGRMLNTSDAAR
jgi:hypothetical protein